MSLTDAPTIHIKRDGPMLVWRGQVHFLTRWERIALWLRLTTAERIARSRFLAYRPEQQP